MIFCPSILTLLYQLPWR